MDFPEHLPHEVYRILPEKPLLLVLDFDGVMTDDRVYVGQDGSETVACTRGDGMGITLLRRAEFPVLVLSTEENPVVGARCRKLRIECRQGCADKTRELAKVLAERKVPAEDVIYVGNDVNDIGCMRLAGCGLAVADAHPLVKKAARAVLGRPGGKGAVREIAELILVRMGRDLLYDEGDRAP
jgi:YrbI family 3-deoxy-D-manno-octulosonate 8-phosphate phosphatase